MKRAEIRARYWQWEVDQLENFRELKIFENGGIDYLHAGEIGAPNRYQPRNQYNANTGKRQLTKIEALELVGRLTRRISGEKLRRASASRGRIRVPTKQQIDAWSKIFK